MQDSMGVSCTADSGKGVAGGLVWADVPLTPVLTSLPCLSEQPECFCDVFSSCQTTRTPEFSKTPENCQGSTLFFFHLPTCPNSISTYLYSPYFGTKNGRESPFYVMLYKVTSSCCPLTGSSSG